MGDIPTVTVKDAKGNMTVINESDYDKAKHGEKATAAEIAAATAASMAAGGSRNPSGTFSEPTPTDIRYPNKDNTEFENNHGAFVGKSAAQMRDEIGLADEPGGLDPERFKEVKAAEEVAFAEAKAARNPAESPAKVRADMLAKADTTSFVRPVAPARPDTTGPGKKQFS